MFNDMISAVKRLLLIVLLALLPLQFSWAAAAAYCQHEADPSTQHFGHHAHQHEAKPDLPDDADPATNVHADCMYCHLACQASFLAVAPDVDLPHGSTYAELPVRLYSSYFPDGLHRPNWRFVA
jgi:hypothetical protein